MLKRKIQEGLAKRGIVIRRVGARQTIPDSLPDASLYTGPEDYSLLFRPWSGREYDKVFTPSVLENTMLSRQKLYYLLKLLKQTQGLEGDLFEAGAGSGGSGRLMLDFLLEAKLDKRLWLLDTFEGYQKVDADRDGAHVMVHQCRCNSKEEVQKLLANDRIDVRLAPGLIPESLKQVATERLSFAHIDVNLYEPTLKATEFCLERMARGAVILFDDYGWPATYGARQAIDEACSRSGQNVICVPESTQAFLIKT